MDTWPGLESHLGRGRSTFLYGIYEILYDGIATSVPLFSNLFKDPNCRQIELLKSGSDMVLVGYEFRYLWHSFLEVLETWVLDVLSDGLSVEASVAPYLRDEDPVFIHVPYHMLFLQL